MSVIVKDPPKTEMMIVPAIDKMREDLGLLDPQAVVAAKPAKAVDPAIKRQADEFLSKLLALDPMDIRAREGGRVSMERAGERLSREGEQISAMMREPLRMLAQVAEGGDPVAKDLMNLNIRMQEIDPHRWDLTPRWWKRLVGNRIKRYFMQYQAAGTVIMAIVKSLENGAERLRRDDGIYLDDQVRASDHVKKLERLAEVLAIVDRGLEAKLGNKEIPEGDERYKFVQEELLFPLRQRLQDILTELAAKQQEVLSIELLRRNNRELIRGVNRVKRVTISALETAVRIALGLAHQKIVIEGIKAITETTEEYLKRNAAQLRSQGVEIHKQAAGTTIGVAVLKAVFTDLHAAFEDLERYRREALPVMAENIRVLDELTGEARARIERMQRGDQARPAIVIDVEAA